MIRNRIISGLSKVIVVVEAGFPSGALNTAKHANEQGRDVFAVPGRVTDAMSAGCNDLLWKGAGVARSAKDVLDALKLGSAPQEEVVLEGLERQLVDLLREEPRHVGEFAELCSVSFGELYETLSNLELREIVKKSSDQRYVFTGIR